MPRACRLAPILALLLAAPAPGSEPEYPHASFTARALGAGGRSYWLFEPAGPRPERAPVVVFHHGWLAMNPGIYGAWVEHLARRGFVVVFPRYQADWTTPPTEFLANAAAAARDALDVLEVGPGRVRPDRDRVAYLGHSAGGDLAARLAALAPEAGLPPPRAVVAICPGEVLPARGPDLARLPSTTLLVVVATEHDLVVGDARARRIFTDARSIAPGRKLYVLYRTDRRGPVPVVADHLAPTAFLPRLDTGEGPFHSYQANRANVDLFDRFGLWRLTDLTLDAAFAGLSLADATASGALLRDLGHWSDGRPVRPPVVGDDLALIPRVALPNGARLVPWRTDEFVRLSAPARR